MRWLDRLLLLLTAVVVGANLVPLTARLHWMLELTAHFRVQYLVVTAALLVLVAVRRQWAACAALAAAGAVSAAAVLPYLPIGFEPKAEAAGAAASLEVLSVNVSYRQFSPRTLLAIIREANPDVLVVQELTPHAETVLAGLDAEFPYNQKFPAEGAYGIGVWSRWPIESSATIALGRVPAIEARLRGPNGTFTVIGVHLRAPVTARRAAARNQELGELAARISATDGPLIVAGDFNATPYTPYFQQWLQASQLTDSRRGRTLSISWPTMLPWAGIPIDHVAVNDGFRILSHRRLPNFESDHYGILVELAPSERAGAP
jgi:endonuclease/exonuclease/phosphatase (EEP) superfamily protein YafD